MSTLGYNSELLLTELMNLETELHKTETRRNPQRMEAARPMSKLAEAYTAIA